MPGSAPGPPDPLARLIRSGFERADQGMALIDATGRILIANPKLAAMVGGDPARLAPGGMIGPATGLSPDVITGGGEAQLAGGAWVRVSRTALDGGAALLFVTDIEAFKERERRFEDEKQQAEAANLAKSRFLANISHELRTPLNAIIGFSEIISGQLFGVIENPKYAEYSANIVESARHLLDIINSVLDLAKSEAGKLRVAEEAVEINELLAGCIRITREQCARAGLILQFHPWPTVLRVFGDPLKLRQVFLNLLSNAIKFTEPGGAVSVTVEAVEGGAATIVIADTGIGMAEQDIPVALMPFEQVDSSLARHYQGTGLGLPLAKALVELHGGALTIASEPGKGTRVTVSLRCEAHPAARGGAVT
jgi:signal transduction histidine kinase